MGEKNGRGDIRHQVQKILCRMLEKDIGLTQKDLAHHAQCDQSTISKALNGRIVNADIFCGALGAAGIDVCALIEEALTGKSFDGIPPVVAEFLDTVGRHWLSETEWHIVYWHAKRGEFSDNTTLGDIHDFLNGLDKKKRTSSRSTSGIIESAYKATE